MMKTCITLLFLLVFQVLAFGQLSTVRSININNVVRSYRIYIPNDLTEPAPLVFNFHGLGSNAIQQELYTAMNPVAEREKFVVVYPEGLDNAFNAGWILYTESDDVSFTSQLIDSLVSEGLADPTRVYSCGMSNGGFMSYRLACELGDKLAAIASVTGGMAPRLTPECIPSVQMPVMQIHGTADSTVWYAGRLEVNDPIESTVQFWVKNNACAQEADTLQLEDINTQDQTTAQRISYDCASPVVFYKIADGEHTWPGSSIDIGITNRDFNATEEIWNFFSQFSRVLTNTNDHQIQDQVSLYPNPVNDILHIDGLPSVDLQKFQIIDIQGNIVLSGHSAAEINVKHLAHGAYILELLTVTGSSQHRFLKL